MSRKLVRQQPLRPLKVKVTLTEVVPHGETDTVVNFETTLETTSLPDLIVRTRRMVKEINTPVEVKTVEAEEPKAEEAKAEATDTNPEPKEA